MITTANIYKAIRERLEDNFVEEIVQVKDLKNPVEPCFLIEYIGSNDSISANDTLAANYTFNIVYFSKDKTLIDLLRIESRLKNIFKNPIKVEYSENSVTKNQFLDISDIDVDIDEDDYILEFELNYRFNQNLYVNRDMSPAEDYYETGEYDNDNLMEDLYYDSNN